MLNLTIIIAALSMILATSISLTGTAEIASDTIAAAWLFEGNAEDASRNRFDGELRGGKFVTGKFGNAIELNGTDEWIEIPHQIGEFQEITFAHWAESTGREAQWRVFFNNNGWDPGDIHYQIHTDNRVEFSIRSNPGGNDTFANFKVMGEQMDKWIHIATAYSATEKKIRFYINGELDAEDEWGGNPGILEPARIGDWNQSRQWQGLLDEFIIFNTVLQPDDIQTVMNNGLQAALAIDARQKLAVTWANLKLMNPETKSYANTNSPN